jgi:transcriptional regulator with XRE-family HTH domain
MPNSRKVKSSGSSANSAAPQLSRFNDNFIRLLGLHGLSQHAAAQLLGVSDATMSSWMRGKSTPSLSKAITIAEFFQISTDKLMGAEFHELLATELSERERYEKVEERIRRAVSPLRAV